MSKTQLQTNNTRLASLIDTLKGKAAGSGGASVETCTVVINNEVVSSGGAIVCYGFTVFEDGKIGYVGYDGEALYESTMTFTNVVCGSAIFFGYSGYSMTGVEVNNMEAVSTSLGLASEQLFIAPTVAGTTGTISMVDMD